MDFLLVDKLKIQYNKQLRLLLLLSDNEESIIKRKFNNTKAEHVGVILQAVFSNRRFTFNDQQFEPVKRLAMGCRLSSILEFSSIQL